MHIHVYIATVCVSVIVSVRPGTVFMYFCLSRQSAMAAQCVTKVELTVSCDNLLDRDIGSKSDPLCVLLMNSSDSKWYEVSRLPVGAVTLLNTS